MDYCSLVKDIKFLITGSSAGTLDFSDVDIADSINRHLDNVVSTILKADGRWQWDDNNFTTLPIGTTTLVAGQQDYEISGANFLNISEVSVLDNNGVWQALTAIDRKGKAQTLLDEEKISNNGLPKWYDKMGNSILLYPKPAADKVTLSAGLKVVSQRKAGYFISTDTTKTPGFAPIYHRILSIGAAIDYCLANGLSQKKSELEVEKIKMEQGIIEFYADRSKDDQPRIKLQQEDFGGDALSGEVISEDKFNI